MIDSIKKQGDYYLIGHDNKPYVATSSSVFKLFHEHKKKINAYLDEHNIDFDNREDLSRLLKFCNGLNEN